MKNNLVWLAGHDNKGKVYINGNNIIRQLHPEHTKYALNIFEIYKKYKLEQIFIVQTDFDIQNSNLIHKKHLISYPFEWTTNMYKEALLFHLNLLMNLDQLDLTLKDALPNNIVFDFCKPIFIDFLSLVKKGHLKRESWLKRRRNNNELRFAVFDSMFIPFMLVPFIAIAEKRYDLGRRMLSEQACNCAHNAPHWKDIYFGTLSNFMLWNKKLFRHAINTVRKRQGYLAITPLKLFKLFNLLLSKEKMAFLDFCEQLKQFVVSVDVTPSKSSYVSYYDIKCENFDLSDRTNWQDKQKAVSRIIDSDKPETMLDIGANTGWFSILAARQGIKVIATDADESSIDTLYLYSKQNELRILPLLIPFENMKRQIFAIDINLPEYIDRSYKTVPIFLPATQRLRSDTVLCLGLLHHLILGEGRSLANVFGILSKLTRKTLVLEYIEKEDALIRQEKSFFKHLENSSANAYNIDAVLKQIKRYFKTYEILNSHPATRKILVCRK